MSSNNHIPMKNVDAIREAITSKTDVDHSHDCCERLDIGSCDCPRRGIDVGSDEGPTPAGEAITPDSYVAGYKPVYPTAPKTDVELIIEIANGAAKTSAEYLDRVFTNEEFTALMVMLLMAHATEPLDLRAFLAAGEFAAYLEVQAMIKAMDIATGLYREGFRPKFAQGWRDKVKTFEVGACYRPRAPRSLAMNCQVLRRTSDTIVLAVEGGAGVYRFEIDKSGEYEEVSLAVLGLIGCPDLDKLSAWDVTEF